MSEISTVNIGDGQRPYEEGMTFEEQAVVYEWLNDGLKVPEIQSLWTTTIARSPISDRQLYLYRERWARHGGKGIKDEAVQWSDTQSFLNLDIRHEHLPVLRDVDNWLEHEFRGFFPKSTYRFLYWGSHLLSWAPEINSELDIFVFGTQLALRDLVFEYSDKTRDMRDLNGLLSYRPWRSMEHQQKYLSATIRGDVPRVYEIAPLVRRKSGLLRVGTPEHLVPSPKSTQFIVSSREYKSAISRQLVFLGMIQRIDPGNDSVLPSAKMAELRAKGINPMETLYVDGEGTTVTIRLPSPN